MEKISTSLNFNTYRNHRAEPYFTFVKNGKKTIEGRIKKDLYASLRQSDHIIVFNNEETDSVEVIIKDLRYYDSFQEMLKKEVLNKILPNVKNIEQGLGIYRKFYTIEQETKFGVVAIEIERAQQIKIAIV